MGKTKKGIKRTTKVYALYEKDGDSVKTKGNFCPKCGKGVFMANHKNRSTCGKCGYTEFKN